MIASVTLTMSPNVSFSSVVPRGMPSIRNSSCQWSWESTSPRTYLSKGNKDYVGGKWSSMLHTGHYIITYSKFVNILNKSCCDSTGPSSLFSSNLGLELVSPGLEEFLKLICTTPKVIGLVLQSLCIQLLYTSLKPFITHTQHHLQQNFFFQIMSIKV